MKLEREFYLNNDVVFLAKELLGKYLYTCFDGFTTGGIISETEAYAGVSDKASHAYNGKRSKRTEIMYCQGGTAYIYLCYGIHSLFNVVTNKKDIPHAILVRGIIPTDGMEKIAARTGKIKIDRKYCDGPGKVSKAMGIHFKDTGIDLTGNKIWIEDKDIKINKKDILISTRIGVNYAAEDAFLPYRFVWTKKSI